MRKGEKRKQDLIRIAYRMFITKGYEHTSVDEIIAEAGIAKGTYYYYFESKEQMLEDVIGMMLQAEAEKAEAVLRSDLSVPEKIVGIIASVHPAQEEQTIEDALHQPENVLMHNKARERMFDLIVPILSRAAEEGVEKGLFYCDHIPERVREEKIFSELADKYHKSNAQIVLRWATQKGFITIPGSKNPDHIRDNFNIFDITLTDEEMAEIAKLDGTKKYYVPDNETVEKYASMHLPFEG